jgi:endonuclease/exonuclease/phosphatase (EEP) superfamily protein YafD
VRRRTSVSVLLAFLMVASLGCAAEPRRTAVGARLDQPHVTVMTFNVNYGMSDDAETLGAITDANADVILLQETTPAWESAIRSRLGESYPHITFKHHGGAGGLAVLSRLPVETVDFLPAENWFPAARVVLETPLGRLQLLNVHLRPPISDGGSVVSGYFATPPVREREIESFASSLDPDIPTLIAGDFNESDNGRAVRWLRERGMRTALPEFQPHAKTWHWQTSVITLNGRYDHLIYDARRLQPLRVEARNVGHSDHIPVVGTFALVDSTTFAKPEQN